MIDLTDLTTVATAADPAVTGCALLKPDREPDPGWVVATLADGSRVRIDGAAPDSPALAALAALDVSPEAQAARELTRARGAALASFLSRSDPTALQVRALLNAIVFLFNNRFEALGQPRLLQPELLGYILQNPDIADPAPAQSARVPAHVGNSDVPGAAPG